MQGDALRVEFILDSDLANYTTESALKIPPWFYRAITENEEALTYYQYFLPVRRNLGSFSIQRTLSTAMPR